MSDVLVPGDMVALEDECGPLPLFDHGDTAVNSLYCDDVAFIVCVSLPPLLDLPDDHGLPADYPLLLLSSGPMGWVLDPHLLRKL